MEIKYRGELYLPYVGYLPNKARNHFIAAIGEFVGTFLFLFFAFAATQVANAAHSGNQKNQDSEDKHSIADIPDTGSLLYIALAFGFSLAVNAWVFFRISGGESPSPGSALPLPSTLLPPCPSPPSSCGLLTGFTMLTH